ncbi:unnamed protein product [Penicillium viridicatum]
MTTAAFRYIDRASYDPNATEPFKKPWGKVDGPGRSYQLTELERKVENLRGQESHYTTDNSGFALYNSPAKETAFTDDAEVRAGYYAEVEELLRKKLPGVKKVAIFDHTIRRRTPGSARSPVQLVHVDQTPRAAEARVRRHLPEDEVEELLKGRYQIINVWRPIENPASDFPLALIDWRSIAPSDFVKVDLLYPKEWQENGEVAPDSESMFSTEGYEVKGETYAIAPNEGHRFFYAKDMTPEEVMFIKCFDSRSHTMTEGKTDIAHGSGHTAFVDPQTPAGSPGRQSIENLKMSSPTSEIRNQPKTWTKGEYLVSTDTSLIPIQTLNTWYGGEEFYWAKPMPEPALRETIQNSLCFGLYHNPNQSDKSPENDTSNSTLEFVGFARCVTDYTTFLFLTDVFVLSSLQGLGLGTWLVTCVQEIIETMPYLRRSLLLTGDWKRSVPFYEKVMDMELMVCNPPVDGKDAVGFAVMQRKSWGAPGFGEMS